MYASYKIDSGIRIGQEVLYIPTKERVRIEKIICKNGVMKFCFQAPAIIRYRFEKRYPGKRMPRMCVVNRCMIKIISSATSKDEQ